MISSSCYKSLAGLRFPWAHTVTVLSPAAALLCGTFATRKKSGFVHHVGDVLWYPTFSHSAPMPGDLALSPLAAVLSSAPAEYPGWLPSCERGTKHLWPPGNLAAAFQM